MAFAIQATAEAGAFEEDITMFGPAIGSQRLPWLRQALLTGTLSFLVSLVPAADGGSQETRSFQIASAPLQVDVDSPIGWSFSFEHMAGDLDMVSMHQDFFGIPWIQLAAGDPLPPSWVAFQKDIQARAAATGLPVYLSLTPLASDRSFLAPLVEETGGSFRLVEGWSGPCFDFATDPRAPDVRRAYIEYVDLMVQHVEPEYLSSVIEINEYFFSCPDGWDALVEFANEVYEHVKAQWPELVVFPTFLIDPYWVLAHRDCPENPVPCLEASLEPLKLLSMDRFGISTYPMVQLAAVGDIPRELITAFAGLVDSPLVIAETGFNSTDIVVSGPPLIGSCRRVLGSSDARQATYMQLLFNDADSLDIDLVTWWSFRDFLPREVGGACPCPLSQFEICLLLSLVEPFEQALFRSFGNMGVLYNDGSKKPVHYIWQSWRARPIRQ